MTTTVRRDPFARQELERFAEPRLGPYGMGYGSCSWCGQKPRTLYRYECVSDGGRRAGKARGAFCNLGCFDAYHG